MDKSSLDNLSKSLTFNGLKFFNSTPVIATD